MKDEPEREYKPVPVYVAKEISRMYEKSQVVILCYDPVHAKTHVTTYGATAWEKDNAAQIGDRCAELVGADMQKQDFNENYKATPEAESRAEIERLWDLCVKHGLDPTRPKES